MADPITAIFDKPVLARLVWVPEYGEPWDAQAWELNKLGYVERTEALRRVRRFLVQAFDGQEDPDVHSDAALIVCYVIGDYGAFYDHEPDASDVAKLGRMLRCADAHRDEWYDEPESEDDEDGTGGET